PCVVWPCVYPAPPANPHIWSSAPTRIRLRRGETRIGPGWEGPIDLRHITTRTSLAANILSSLPSGHSISTMANPRVEELPDEPTKNPTVEEQEEVSDEESDAEEA